MMNKILILAAAITASSSAAFAGGAAAPETEAAVAASVAPAEAHDWSGFYAGASVGQNNGADDWAGEYFLAVLRLVRHLEALTPKEALRGFKLALTCSSTTLLSASRATCHGVTFLARAQLSIR